jgi:NAD(P)-dependent dehydrogenase (short-subunit alcohol dehydrogenase family)
MGERSNNMRFDGKRIVVIGGTSGIGLATAKMAVENGAEVVIASRNPDRLDKARSEIGGKTEAFPLDISKEEDGRAFFAKIGEFDHLTTPGSSITGGAFLTSDTAVARADFDSKFWGQYYAAKYGAPKIRPGGSIVLFSGVYSIRPPAGFSSVAAVNGAIESLTRGLTVELAPLRVNAIVPGLVETPIYGQMPADQREAMFKQVAESLPARKIGQPEDIAQAVLFLMGNTFAAGTILVVDGGYTMR